MPKADKISSSIPLSGLFAVYKPSGQICMAMLNRLQPLFASSPLFADHAVPNKSKRSRKARNRVKMGQGGTLDPLAEGVLVIGVGAGTKQLSKLLDSTKEYNTTGIFGCATDSYDSHGKRTSITSHDHITKESILNILPQFRGTIQQMPPLHSAIKMDGMPLYEYARSGTPLPRPISARTCDVSSLTLDEFCRPVKESDTQPEPSSPSSISHSYHYPTANINEKERTNMKDLHKLLKTTLGINEENGKELSSPFYDLKLDLDKDLPDSDGPTGQDAPIVTLSMKVSSGTYVRSIVHDLGLALESTAHVVRLQRTRQGHFDLKNTIPVSAPTTSPPSEDSKKDSDTVAIENPILTAPTHKGCVIPWEVFEKALIEFESTSKKEKESMSSKSESTLDSSEIPLKEWERVLLTYFEPCGS